MKSCGVWRCLQERFFGGARAVLTSNESPSTNVWFHSSHKALAEKMSWDEFMNEDDQ